MITKWLQDGRMIYSLHKRKSGELCNKFQMIVSPDHGSDLTNKDAEIIAGQIVTQLNSFDIMLDIKTLTKCRNILNIKRLCCTADVSYSTITKKIYRFLKNPDNGELNVKESAQLSEALGVEMKDIITDQVIENKKE